MIVCIGDSITYGQHVEFGWADLLGYANAGVPGDTTRLGLERFPRDVQERHPERVYIQFGHNDANRWRTDCGLTRVSLDAYRANLAEMIARARQFGIEPLLIGMTKPDRAPEYVETCQAYDAAAFQVSQLHGVRWLSMWDAFVPSDYLDGLHLNEDGHRKYADRIAAWF